MMAAIMLVLCFANTARADWDVKPSAVNYKMELNNARTIFLYNKNSIGSEVGTEYYMTYTVEKATITQEQRHQGVAGALRPKRYPYDTDDRGGGGFYHFNYKNNLLMEGYTYFFKFKITEDGYDYRVAWAKGNDSMYIKLPVQEGEIKTGLKYFGVFFADYGINATLTKIRCYDKNGNDLGVAAAGGTAETMSIGWEEPFQKAKGVNHSYTVFLKDVTHSFALTNRIPATTDTIYMEYKVKSSTGTRIHQVGAITTNTPLENDATRDGYLRHTVITSDPQEASDAPIFIEGAEYLLIFKKMGDKFDVIMQYTLNGKTKYIDLNEEQNTYKKDKKFSGLFIGIPRNFPTNVELVDFKCYDENKNNLGVQCNQKAEIIHYGELEDYSGCEAVYFNEKDQSLYALYEDKKVKFTTGDATIEGAYAIEGNTMTVDIGNEQKSYNYMYQYFKDENENVYHRLHEYKIVFDTGEGTSVETQIINNENGYRATRPENPTLKGTTFEGWYTAEGEEYNFDNIVHDSVTLYAKWAHTDYVSNGATPNYMPYVLIGTGTLILVLSITMGIFMIRRRKKDGSSSNI